MKHTQTSSERRIYSRVPYHAEVLMQSGDEEWSVNLLDISLKGMLVEPPESIDIDTRKPCALALFLGEDAAIHARVTITHTSKGNWGLQWKHIDITSLRHLRRLLELNLNDPSLMGRELAELG
jgi:PilZ domain